MGTASIWEIVGLPSSIEETPKVYGQGFKMKPVVSIVWFFSSFPIFWGKWNTFTFKQGQGYTRPVRSREEQRPYCICKGAVIITDMEYERDSTGSGGGRKNESMWELQSNNESAGVMNERCEEVRTRQQWAIPVNNWEDSGCWVEWDVWSQRQCSSWARL